MTLLKRLISDTAVYGTSSILARGLNYLLTFLIASIIPTHEFGVFTDLYAMVGFMLVLLTHGMETSFFRHVNIYEEDRNVFGTAFFSVASAATVFLLAALAFQGQIAAVLRYPDQSDYIAIFSFIIFFDVMCSVPFARLRQAGKARTFAFIKIANIILTIFLNIFLLIICPELAEGRSQLSEWVVSWYDHGDKVAYVFIANLVTSALTLLLLLPSAGGMRWRIDPTVYRRMLAYAMPVMVMGFAGVINEMFDRKILRYLLPYDDLENLRLVGIYGFAYKLSMIMALFLQAYRYAVEPILFSEAGKEKAPSAYAAIMRYYTMAASLLFVLIVCNLPLLQYLLFDLLHFNADYQEAFLIVPVLLAANGFLGIYFNVSTWYKVSDQTIYGAFIALFGAVITVSLNLWLVPLYGYAGSAWATLACYTAMTLLALWIGQRKYPIPYEYSKLLSYLVAAAFFFSVCALAREVPWWVHTLFSVAAVAVFLRIFRYSG